LQQEVGPDMIFAMQRIKEALDPHWIMNPGKIFDLPAEITPRQLLGSVFSTIWRRK
jgi:hypothetical protein